MRTWGITLVLLATLGWLGASSAAADEESPASESGGRAVVVVKKDGTKTVTVRLVQDAQGRWVAEESGDGAARPARGDEDQEEGARAADGEEEEEVVVWAMPHVRTGPVEGGDASIHLRRLRPQTPRPAAPAVRSPLHTILRYLLEHHAGKRIDGDPLEAWFQGESVPLRGLRDALRADGWTAARVHDWLRALEGALPPLASHQDPHDAWDAGPFGFPGPRPRGAGPGGWGPPGQAGAAGQPAFLLFFDGQAWRVEPLPGAAMPPPAASGFGPPGPPQWGRGPAPDAPCGCNCPDCPKRPRGAASRPGPRGWGMGIAPPRPQRAPDGTRASLDEAVQDAIRALVRGQLEIEVESLEDDAPLGLLERLLPSVAIEALGEARTSCEDCPKKGACTGRGCSGEEKDEADAEAEGCKDCPK